MKLWFKQQPETTLDSILLARWQKCSFDFHQLFPDAPQPQLKCGYRPPSIQFLLYLIGKLPRRKAVTFARAGESLHNRYPARAFDVTFRTGMQDEVYYLTQFATVAKQQGLVWGGDWKQIKDYRHFELPNPSPTLKTADPAN